MKSWWKNESRRNYSDFWRCWSFKKIKQLPLLAGVLPLRAFLIKVKTRQPKSGKAAMCSDRCDFEEEEFCIECYRLFGLARTSTVWSPSHISSRLPLISPGASQTVPLMLWGPSFTHSIFDLSYFLQLKPAEVYSHRPTPLFITSSSHSFPPMRAEMTTSLTPKDLFCRPCNMKWKSVLIDRSSRLCRSLQMGETQRRANTHASLQCVNKS